MTLSCTAVQEAKKAAKAPPPPPPPPTKKEKKKEKKAEKKVRGTPQPVHTAHQRLAWQHYTTHGRPAGKHY